jgi:hypothetical protein
LVLAARPLPVLAKIRTGYYSSRPETTLTGSGWRNPYYSSDRKAGLEVKAEY